MTASDIVGRTAELGAIDGFLDRLSRVDLCSHSCDKRGGCCMSTRGVLLMMGVDDRGACRRTAA
jgi:hypothetical protein